MDAAAGAGIGAIVGAIVLAFARAFFAWLDKRHAQENIEDNPAGDSDRLRNDLDDQLRKYEADHGIQP